MNAPTEKARHEFDALNTLLLVVILGMCTLTSYLIKRYQIYYLPESAAALLVGILVGGVARLIDPSKAELDFLSFQPELFFFLLLPPIIFEAGYTLRRKHFFRNFGTIVAYAVLGTLVSTFIIGYLTFAIGKLGWITIDTSNPMEPLLFGALISAVDPVATLSIMGSPELNCDPLLYSLVFGESVLNDAVAIVLFRVFSTYYHEEESLDHDEVPPVILEFIVVSCGSVVVGVIIGLLCSFLFKHTQIRQYPTYEIGLLFLFAYGSYALAEAVELSGIMALFFCGIVLAHYNSYNLSDTSQVGAEVIFQSLSQVSETFVFLYMGMGLFTGRFSGWSAPFIIFAIFFCLIARLFNTFPISFISNLQRKRKIPIRMQFVIWFSGLRGAIAFALSQNMPGKHKETYEATTLAVVFFTTFVCGGMTEKLLKATGMRRDSPPNQTQPSEILLSEGLEDDAFKGLDADTMESMTLLDSSLSTRSENLSSGIHRWWKTFDNNLMKPFFGGSFVTNQ